MVASKPAAVRGAVAIAVILVATGCRSLDPMGYDFHTAAAAETEAPIIQDAVTAAAMKRFLAEYGTNAVPFLSDVLLDEQCAREGSGLRRAWAAVRGLRALRDERSRPALKTVHAARCSSPLLRWQILRALAELDGRSTAPIAVEELDSEHSIQDVHLLVEILSSGDASVARRLAQLGDTGKDPQDRMFYRFLGLVMMTPGACRLNPHGSVSLEDGSGYLCQYTCASMTIHHEERQNSVCATSIPNPSGPMASTATEWPANP